MQVEYPHRQSPHPFLEADLGSDKTHPQDDEQANPADFPISSGSGWEEPGTLSSHDGGFAQDFDAERDGFSDAGEDEQMLDCSDIDEGEPSARERKGSGMVEGQLEVADSILAVFYTPPDASEQERAVRMAYGEVSRFFSSSTTGFPGRATDDAALAWKGDPEGTAVEATLVASYRHETTMHDTSGFGGQAIRRATEGTFALVPAHGQDRDSALGIEVQGRPSFVADDHVTKSCDIHPSPVATEVEELHSTIQRSDNAGPGSPQDFARGPLPGDFNASLQATKELDYMFDEELGPPVSQSMGRTKFAMVSKIGRRRRLLKSRRERFVLPLAGASRSVKLKAHQLTSVSISRCSKPASFPTPILLLVR